ncbi:hypothetical protein [Paenibacillus macquariensis]|uniref:Uncharacterized protein n=1 Tax=Paenibacillus macquariensis TaxID=948756 RepID=A0ABY1K781_9BACL|nr:hypothetical protein [Paenibacillus macquariensis]MEC0092495.1 hypothetical protein [Paenibacillus macquariensis]OAB35453.1 hypothetical protein PMSM_09360 [Paenibacillus macquariensis subsp. macquariensis]SIR35415.1 hypothetical protein SAMN05421578_111171 [Paenibacillus macquariensis]
MILKNALNFGGRLYEAGENVKGELPLDMIEVLKEKNAFSDIDITSEEVNGEPPTLDDGVKVATASVEKSVAELEEHLKTILDVEEINALLEEENKREQPRASAIKALEKRMKEL